jgi:hypothetical protein
MEDTYKEARETVLRLAAEAFAKHEIAVEGTDRWLCRRPKGDVWSSYYWFRILIAPRTVVLLGDVGDAIFECSEYDALSWLRGTDERGYLLSKLHALSRCSGGQKKFYAGDALAWARESKTDEPKGSPWRAFWSDVEGLNTVGDLNEHEWHEAIRTHGLDVDAHSVGQHPSEGALWAVEAVLCFRRLLATLPINAFAGLP